MVSHKIGFYHVGQFIKISCSILRSGSQESNHIGQFIKISCSIVRSGSQESWKFAFFVESKIQI